jgi:hypothetical protein
MEILFQFIGQLIGETLLSLVITPLYFLIVKPILILLGFISVLIEKCLKKDVKPINKTSFDELEQMGKGLIQNSLVIVLLLGVVSMMVIFAVWVF